MWVGLALCRVRNGSIRKGQQIAWCRANGEIERAAVTELYITESLDRVDAAEAGPGEIIAVAGLPDVTIGETLADPEDPRPLPVISVDEPSLSVTVGINTSPLAGQDGSRLTARQVKDRLDQELIGNVSIRVNDTERPDAWEVQGRGELQLAVLVELMRREGFELTVGQPQVLTREIDGKVHEPVERLAIDAPEDYVGVITQLLALRKGRLEQMVNHGTGWVRMEYQVPARGLIGFRTEFLTETRGTGILHHVFDGWQPWAGEMRTRPSGSLVADRRGQTASFALFGLQERGTLFVGPGEEVYEGMIVGENARARRPRRERRQGEAAQQHPLLHRRGARAPRAGPQALTRPGAGVPARGRGRRGHAGLGAPAQAAPGEERAGEGGPPREEQLAVPAGGGEIPPRDDFGRVCRLKAARSVSSSASITLLPASTGRSAAANYWRSGSAPARSSTAWAMGAWFRPAAASTRSECRPRHPNAAGWRRSWPVAWARS